MNLNERPEGATHYQPQTHRVSERWFDFSTKGEARVFCRGRWQPASVVLEDEPATRFVVLPWNGESSLQAGMQCEYSLTNGGVWHDCTVKYVLSNGKQLVADCAGNPDGEAVLHFNTCQFRTLRTPEQIAEEERQREISEIHCELVGMAMSEDDAPKGTTDDWQRVAEFMHAKGYRKQVAP